MIKVVIADDIMILRQGLQAILELDKDIQVVGMATNGNEAYELCESIMPDIVLMDMRMPVFDGAYGTKKIKESYPQIKVLVLTTFDDDETIEGAIQSGADGYILKEMENEKIIQSVKSVCQGVNVFGQGVFLNMRTKMKKPTVTSETVKTLTSKELEIIKCVVEGMDNKEIATTLFLAEGTVRNNISKLLEKLELKDRTQLAVFGVKNNLD